MIKTNDASKKDAYPMPDARDNFDRMGGSAIFSKLDAAAAYWSVPMKEEQRELTAFVFTRGQFEFKRMPFDLANSQGTYQRAIDKALHLGSNAQAFVDDTCVYSKDFESHLQHLSEVFGKIGPCGIPAETRKVCFWLRRI